MLSSSQKLLLSIVFKKDGKLNWYKISRAYLKDFGSPAELSESFSFLEKEGFIESRTIDNEPLPKIFVTEKGSMLFQE